MQLRGTDFGVVMNASGARGFFGEGYPFHKLFRHTGLDYTGANFVAKTTTLHPNKGNMPFKADGITPQELLPACIKVNIPKGTALNAVGLSGPGASSILNRGGWNKRTKPFILSFMAIEQTLERRQKERYDFTKLFKSHVSRFKAPMALEINFSCPNTEHDPNDLLREIESALEITSDLDIPQIVKLNILANSEAVVAISEHPACDAICVSNTIPWGQLPEYINWKALFGPESPLKHWGGGGLSGKPLLKPTGAWIARARKQGLQKPIIGGGGIVAAKDGHYLYDQGATAVELGSVSFLRPWRVQSIIRACRNRTY